MSAVEKFPILLSEAEEESSAVPPCFSDEGINVRMFFVLHSEVGWLGWLASSKRCRAFARSFALLCKPLRRFWVGPG